MVTHHRFAEIAGRRIFYQNRGRLTHHTRSRAAVGDAGEFTPVAQPDPGARRPISRHRPRLPRLRCNSDVPGGDRCHGLRSTTSPATLTRCSTTSACREYAIYVQDYGAPVELAAGVASSRPHRGGHPAAPKRLRGGFVERRDGTVVRLRSRAVKKPTPPRCASSSAWMG